MPNGDDGIFLADSIDIVLDPDVGPDENGHNSYTDTDMGFDRGASVEKSSDRNLLECRYVDGSTNISQGCFYWMVLTTGDSRVVVACPRNQLAHPGRDRVGRQCREKE